jgi:hypothetical protein
MPFLANQLRLRTFLKRTSPHIFGARNGFQMIWIYATPIATEVVNVEMLGDRTMNSLI